MKALKKIIASIIILIIGLFLYDCSQAGKVASNRPYKETDTWVYYIYTDKDIKNAPRISDEYHFTWVEEDGSRPQTSTIIFSQAEDASPLKSYLTNMGFQKEEGNSLDEVWSKKGDFQTIFHLYIDAENKRVVFSKSHFSGSLP